MGEGGMTNQLAQVGQFCPNKACELYGDSATAPIMRFAKTRNGTQRCCCQCSGQTFTETYGTVFYRRQGRRETMIVAGLTEHVWLVEELLSCVPVLDNT